MASIITRVHNRLIVCFFIGLFPFVFKFVLCSFVSCSHQSVVYQNLVTFKAF